MSRTAKIHRKTGETEIDIALTIEGKGNSRIATKIPFFDHMLTLFARHSLMDLDVKADGDIEVDLHHTVEDTGIALGQAFAQALGDKKGLRRYGWAYLPMDETLARVVVDFSGRPFLEFRAPDKVPSIGAFAFQLVEEFLRGFCVHAGCNLHAEILYGRDAHHMAEAIFKGLAKAVDAACQLDPRVEGVPSTKGIFVSAWRAAGMLLFAAGAAFTLSSCATLPAGLSPEVYHNTIDVSPDGTRMISISRRGKLAEYQLRERPSGRILGRAESCNDVDTYLRASLPFTRTIRFSPDARAICIVEDVSESSSSARYILFLRDKVDRYTVRYLHPAPTYIVGADNVYPEILGLKASTVTFRDVNRRVYTVPIANIPVFTSPQNAHL